ncbi:MAG: hypothetical protein ACR2PL_17570 [Dehalococcoidia bacterium]
MTSKAYLHHLIDGLPENALSEAERLLDQLRDRGLPRILAEAPWDDEPETEEERAAVEEAYKDSARGEVYTMEEVERLLGL